MAPSDPPRPRSVQNRHYLWEDGGANVIGVDMAEPAAVSKINTFGPAPAPTTVEKWSKKIEDNPWTVVGLASGAVLLLVLAGAGCWKWGLCPRQCKKQPKPGPVGAQGKADWASEEAERLQGAARAEGAEGTSPADTPAASPV